MYGSAPPATPSFANGSSTLLTVGGTAVQPPGVKGALPPSPARFQVTAAGAAAGTLVYLYAAAAAGVAGIPPVAGTPGNGFALVTGQTVLLTLSVDSFYSIGSSDATAEVVLAPA